MEKKERKNEYLSYSTFCNNELLNSSSPNLSRLPNIWWRWYIMRLEKGDLTHPLPGPTRKSNQVYKIIELLLFQSLAFVLD